VSGAFFVRGAAAFAGNLALLFGGHRGEASPFLAFSCIHRWASFRFTSTRHNATEPNTLQTSCPDT
jgi:hypothetical protein